MNPIKKYPKQTGYVMLIAGILFSSPYLHTLILSTFVAIVQPEKLNIYNYLLVLGESVLIQYTSVLPAIILIVFGIIMIKKYDK